MPQYSKNPETIQALSTEQYHITQKNGTEAPGSGALLQSTDAGLYVDIVSGEPLFTSTEKFDSGCGWPSFTKPVETTHVIEIQDQSHGMIRTEVRSTHGDSHLGHVFTDGPQDRGGLRYCINSAALRFIPLNEMEQAGYGAYIEQISKAE